jgi:hypothetical protein
VRHLATAWATLGPSAAALVCRLEVGEEPPGVPLTQLFDIGNHAALLDAADMPSTPSRIVRRGIIGHIPGARAGG